ncbi:uncharacterized protein [Eucyclogobius newberryi]|uniref:uncharacterized protein n=1 Tax=Eucyclogobius newberryi TaxID=166745 RepID=UPI003B590238
MDDLKPSDVLVIFCEMCPEEDRKPARKTCMKCEISMCVHHLQAHLTTPVLLQTHPLTEPMAFGGATKCPQHGKLVEYYCLDDLTCVCVSCAIEDQHRLHNLKTFSTAHKELLEKLLTDQKELLFKTDDDNLSLEKWEKKENTKVTNSSVRLIEAISNLRDLTLASVQTSVSARMVSIQTSKNSIQAAQNEKDTYRFLQQYSKVHQDVEKAKVVDLRKGLEPGPDREKLVKEISTETIIEQAVDFWGSLLEMVDPENHQELIPTSEDLLFEPQMFSSGMLLSSDKREVLYCSNMGQCAAVLLIQSTTSADITRWIISLPQDYDWIIGVCDKRCVNNLKHGPVYGLSCEADQISVLSTEHVDTFSNSAQTDTLVISSPRREVVKPETVEVTLTSSVLSYFSRSGQYQRQLIHSQNIDPTVQDLKHFVKLGKENGYRLSKCDSKRARGIHIAELICKLV